VTVEDHKLGRLKEDIIKILAESKKFGIYITERIKPAKKKTKKTEEDTPIKLIRRFTDKMYCAECNVVYPEFTTQHFSPNKQE
jgi:hypothetical protein